MTRSQSSQVTELQKANDCLTSERDRLQTELAETRSHLETLQQEHDRLQKSASQERAQLLSTIAEVANLLHRSPDCTTVLPDVVRLLEEAVGSDRCSLIQEFIQPELNKSVVKLLIEWCHDDERRKSQQALLQAEQERTAELERLNIELQQALDRLSESEERYRTLFELSSEGIHRFEFDEPIPLYFPIEDQVELICRYFRISEANATCTAMYRKNHPDGLVGLRLSDFHVIGSERNHAVLQTYVENGYAANGFESVEVDMDGNSRYFLNNTITMIKNDHAIGGWASQLDITELRLAQQALLEAEQQRVAELANANADIKQCLDVLATDPEITSLIAQILKTIATQLKSPLVEYWTHGTDNVVYIEDLYRTDRHYSKAQIHRCFPHHPGVVGYRVPDDLFGGESVYHRQHSLLIEDLSTSLLADIGYWHQEQGVQKFLSVPLIFGENSIGAIAVYLRAEQSFSPNQCELVRSLTHQATLAIKLTRLAEESRQFAIIQDRNHLAREIHDTLAQGYAGILMQIQAVNFLLKQQPDQAKVHLDRACALAREGIADARRSVWLLQQDSEAYSDVSSILAQLVEQIAIGTGIQPTITIDGTPRSVKPDTGMHLLRITQESLNNALHHAGASAIAIRLNYTPKQLQIAIDDNGCGFETDQLTCGFGIKGMRQRADLIGAQLQIQSQPNQGTHIELNLPLT